MPQFTRFICLGFVLLSPLSFASSQIRSEIVIQSLPPKVFVLNQHALLQVASDQFEATVDFMEQQEPGFKNANQDELFAAKEACLDQLEAQMPEDLAQNEPTDQDIRQAQNFFKHQSGQPISDLDVACLTQLLPIWLAYQTEPMATTLK